MVRVVGSVDMGEYKPPFDKQEQTKWYSPETPTDKVKEDFGKVLDKEMERLRVDVLI